jgi:hypothetical protein
MAASFLLASGLSACSGAGGSLPVGNQSTIAAPTSNSNVSSAPIRSLAVGVRAASSTDVGPAATANAAGVAVDVGGKSTGTWIADAYVSGGLIATTTTNINTNALHSAPQAVYQANRYGSTLTAVIPNLTPLTAYTVRLHFAETFWNAAGKRAFNTSINGTAVLTNFDVFKAAGGKNVAINRQFTSSADANGKVTVVLSVVTDNAAIAGIEVLRVGASPTPAPTVAPTPLPSPVSTPTPGSTPTPSGWHNAFPAWNGNKLLPANPVIHPQSQAMMNLLYNNTNGHGLTGPALDDAQSSYYDAKASDPLHTIHCVYKWGPKPSGNCVMEGKQIHIPAGAVPGANSDQHTSILQPDGCTLDDFWVMQKDMSQSALTAYFGAEYNQCAGTGFVLTSGAGATQGGGSNRLGRTTVAELQTGVIHHAIEVADSCNPVAYSVGQSTAWGNPNNCVAGDSGPSMPYGSYVWSDVKPANLPAGLDKATRMICTALNQYGGVIDDTIGPWNGMSLNTMWNTSGNPEYAAWFKANSSNGATHPASCFPNGDWVHHIHVLQW